MIHWGEALDLILFSDNLMDSVDKVGAEFGPLYKSKERTLGRGKS